MVVVTFLNNLQESTCAPYVDLPQNSVSWMDRVQSFIWQIGVINNKYFSKQRNALCLFMGCLILDLVGSQQHLFLHAQWYKVGSHSQLRVHYVQMKTLQMKKFPFNQSRRSFELHCLFLIFDAKMDHGFGWALKAWYHLRKTILMPAVLIWFICFRHAIWKLCYTTLSHNPFLFSIHGTALNLMKCSI